jgi:hypothetical protein
MRDAARLPKPFVSNEVETRWSSAWGKSLDFARDERSAGFA